MLYGSLSKTGRGHGTDRVLYEVLGRERTEVVFSETPHSLPHPNTLDFFACREGKPYATMRVASIGGGDIRIEGQDAPQDQDEIYPENSFAEIAQFCRWRYISLSEYVELNEGPGIWDFLAEVWQTMKQAVADGLAAEGTLPGGLNVERKAKRLYAQSKENERPQVRELRIVCAYAFAVSGAECRQRHHRHRADLRLRRRAARRAAVHAENAQYPRCAGPARAGRR